MTRPHAPLALLLATSALACATTADTITVCAEGCDHVSVNAAIDAANDGDVIQLAAETYTEEGPIDTDGKAVTTRRVGTAWPISMQAIPPCGTAPSP